MPPYGIPGWTPNQPQLAELTAAVAAPSPVCREIRPDNTVGRTFPTVQAATAADVAFAVRPDPDLLIIDLDLDCADPDGRAREYGRLRQLLHDTDVAHVEVASGRHGHRHLYVRVGRAAVGAIAEALAGSGLDVRRGGGMIRPPGAPHRTGAPSVVCYPTSPSAAVAALTTAVPSDAVAALTAVYGVAPQRSTAASDLVGAYLQVLAGGSHPDRAYESRSEAVRAVMVHAAWRGWDPDRIAELVHGSPLWKAGRQKSRRHLQAEAERAAQVVDRRAAQTALRDRNETIVMVRAVRDVLPAVEWPTRTGSLPTTLVAVADAVCRVAERLGKLTFGLAVREAAELAGMSEGAISKALTALHEIGLVRKVQRGTAAGRPAQFKLIVTHPLLDVHPVNGLARPTPTPTVHLMHADHDVFRARGLGKAALLVWSQLDRDETKTAAQLSQMLRRTAGHMRRALRRLEDVGLAVRDGCGGWVRAAAADLDGAARTVGTAGAGLRQRFAHAKSRAEQRRRRKQWTSPSYWIDGDTGQVSVVDRGSGEVAQVLAGVDGRTADPQLVAWAARAWVRGQHTVVAQLRERLLGHQRREAGPDVVSCAA